MCLGLVIGVIRGNLVSAHGAPGLLNYRLRAIFIANRLTGFYVS